MWKVSNIKNKEFLDKFTDKIIIPLFDFIIKLKDSGYSKFDFPNFEKEISSLLNSSFPKVVFKKKYKEIECWILILDLLKANTLEQLQNQKIIYQKQNLSINAGNYSLDPEYIPDELYRIFSHILYTQCFDDDECWDYIQTGVKYKRADFHSNFKSENEDRTICSLCDTETVIAKSNGIVEHFLPRNKFPYLSMNANNLTTCCNACNLGEEGKGTGSVNPIWAPFSRQIGDNVKFTIKTDKIIVTPKVGNIAIDNYIDLMKVNKRFATKDVYNSSITRLNAEISLHNQLIEKLPVENVLSIFIQNLEGRKNEGFYFLKRNYFGDNYKEYLKELNSL